MAKIVQSLTQPPEKYDRVVFEYLVRDIQGIIDKLNTTFQKEIEDENDSVSHFLTKKWQILL